MQQHSLLRIHKVSLARRNPEYSGVETLYIIEEAAESANETLIWVTPRNKIDIPPID